MTSGTTTHVFVFRGDHYGKTLQWVNKLVAEARTYFPDLEDKDIDVLKFGGDRIKGIMGIEFHRPADVEVPEGFREIYDVHLLS